MLILLLLSAFVLRVVHLDYRSLWWDEGRNIFFAGIDWVSAAELAVRSGDVNPPIYRLVLGIWMYLAGSSPFVVRLPSVFFGLVAVALVYRLAKDLYAERVAVIAVAMTVIAPPLVYYSQEAKGYSLVVMCAVFSVWLWIRLHRRSLAIRSSAEWVWFGIVTLFFVGSHYFAALFLLAQNLWTIVWSCDKKRVHVNASKLKHLTTWIGVQVLALAPLLVYAWWSVEALMGSAGCSTFDLCVPALPDITDLARWGATNTTQLSQPGLHSLNFLRGFWHEIVGGPASTVVLANVAGFTILVLTMTGWYYSASRRFSTINWVILLGMPLLLAGLFSLRFSYYFPRFLIYILPFVIILAAVGVERLWRLNRASVLILGLLLCGVWSTVLTDHYVDRGDPDEDWRELASRFTRLRRTGDLVVHSYDWIQGYLHSYLPATIDQNYLFFAATELQELQRMVSSRSRVWFLDYQTTPFAVGNLAGEWMREHYGLATSESFGNAQMTLFVRPVVGKAQREVVGFSNGIEMHWHAFETKATSGDALSVELIWIAPSASLEAYQIFLHLVDADDRLWAGRDGGPMNDLRPTISWLHGETVRSVHALLLPLELPSGQYNLRAGMYDLESGVRLQTESGADSVRLGNVQVSLLNGQ